jgi:hypothetical protein
MKAKIGAIGEISGGVKSIKREGDSLKGIMEVSGQVPYDIEATLTRTDIRQIIGLVLRPSIVWYAVTSLIMPKKDEPETDESEDMDW